jgi:glucose/arabinose dehydrogenase
VRRRTAEPRNMLDISPPFQAEIVADLDHPWAMTFLPDGRMLVTEKRGSLHVVTQSGKVSQAIGGVPSTMAVTAVWAMWRSIPTSWRTLLST